MSIVALVGLLLVITVFQNAFALKCYSCVRENNVDAMEYCTLPSSGSSLGNNTITNCTVDEERCVIVSTIIKSGTTTTFRRGCTALQSCDDKCSAPSSDGEVICTACCKEDLCNKGIGSKPRSGAARISTSSWFLLVILGACKLRVFFL